MGDVVQTANTAKHAICECLFSFKAVVIDVGLAELFPPSEADSFSSRALNDIASRVSFRDDSSDLDAADEDED